MSEPSLKQTPRDLANSLNQLNLFGMTKQALIKKLQILSHELKIYYRLQQQQANPYKQATKAQIQQQLIIQSYKHNQQVLTKKITALQKTNQQLISIIEQKQLSLNKQIKEVQLHKKKIEELEKSERKIKQQNIEDNQQQQRKIKEENANLRRIVAEKTKKCQILEEINRETELQAAEAILKQQHSKITKEQNVIEQENNPIAINTKPHPHNQLELLSLKQQVKTLKAQLKSTEQHNQQLKLKIQQREHFYSKLLSTNY